MGSTLLNLQDNSSIRQTRPIDGKLPIFQDRNNRTRFQNHGIEQNLPVLVSRNRERQLFRPGPLPFQRVSGFKMPGEQNWHCSNIPRGLH